MISIIIPTYKRTAKLQEAIKSVFSQTLSDFEILVVDDDSTSNDAEITVKAFNDERLKYLKNTRKKGGNGARNTGILSAKGSYIAFLDDDDTWYPEKLQAQLSKMDGLDSSWAGCYCGWHTEGVNYCNGKEGDLLTPFLLHKNPIGASSTLMVRKAVIDDIGLWNEDLVRFQDYDFIVRIFKKYKFAFVNKPLVVVNGHNYPPYSVFEEAKEVYLENIKPLLQDIDINVYKQFLAYQYREVALIASLNGKTNRVLHFLKKSLKHTTLPLRNYISMPVYLVNYYTFKLHFGKFKDYMKKLYA